MNPLSVALIFLSIAGLAYCTINLTFRLHRLEAALKAAAYRAEEILHE